MSEMKNERNENGVWNLEKMRKNDIKRKLYLLEKRLLEGDISEDIYIDLKEKFEDEME